MPQNLELKVSQGTLSECDLYDICELIHYLYFVSLALFYQADFVAEAPLGADSHIFNSILLFGFASLLTYFDFIRRISSL